MTPEWPMVNAGTKKDKQSGDGEKKDSKGLESNIDCFIYPDLFKAGFHDIFKRHKNGKERIAEIKTLFSEFMNKDIITEGEKIDMKLDECESIEDRDEFVRKVFEIFIPIINFIVTKKITKE